MMTADDPLRSTDRLALRLLAEQYARGADTCHAETFADVFTDDAALDTSRTTIVGRADLLQVAPRLAQYEATMHFVGNHHVVFDPEDPDRARGEVYCVAEHVYLKDEMRRNYVMNIRYHDEYVRLPEGWRISARRLELLWDDDRALTTRADR